MGLLFKAICKKCGKENLVREGGGFLFHLFHCNKCGKEQEIKIEEAVRRSLVKIPKKYIANLEKKTKKCKCGGSFKYNALPRCPKCKTPVKSIKNVIGRKNKHTLYD